MMTAKRIDIRALEIVRDRTTQALNREAPPAPDRPFRRPTAVSIDASILYQAALALEQNMRERGYSRTFPHEMNAKARALISEIAGIVADLEREAAR